MHSENYRNAIIPRKGSIIPLLETTPVPFQCIGETNSSLTAGGKLDGQGTLEFPLRPERRIRLLRYQFARGGTSVNLMILISTLAYSTLARRLHGPIYVFSAGRLELIRLSLSSVDTAKGLTWS